MGNSTSYCSGVLGTGVEIILFQVLFVFVIASGLLGNTLSLVVWLKGEKSRNTKCALYFIFLSASDLCLVLWPGTLTYLAEAWNSSIIDEYVAVCSSYMFCSYSFTQMSAWLTVAVTVERTLCTVFPFKYRSTSKSQKKTYIAITVIILSSVLPNIVQLFAYKSDVTPYNTTTCGIKASMEEPLDHLRVVLYIFMATLLPLATTLTCNIILVTKLAHNQFRENRRHDQSKTITRLVMAIGVVFMVSTVPWSVYLVSELPWLQNYIDFETVGKIACAAMVPTYLNNALNPWLYCFFGQAFRNDIMTFLKRYGNKSTAARTPGRGANEPTKQDIVPGKEFKGEDDKRSGNSPTKNDVSGKGPDSGPEVDLDDVKMSEEVSAHKQPTVPTISERLSVDLGGLGAK